MRFVLLVNGYVQNWEGSRSWWLFFLVVHCTRLVRCCLCQQRLVVSFCDRCHRGLPICFVNVNMTSLHQWKCFHQLLYGSMIACRSLCDFVSPTAQHTRSDVAQSIVRSSHGLCLTLGKVMGFCKVFQSFTAGCAPIRLGPSSCTCTSWPSPPGVPPCVPLPLPSDPQRPNHLKYKELPERRSAGGSSLISVTPSELCDAHTITTTLGLQLRLAYSE